MAVRREKLVRNAEKLVSRGKVEAAIREYRKLLADQPKDTNTLNRVGDLYARIHRIDEAVRLFSQIAGQYTDEGFFVKAIAIYKKIIKLDPTRLSVYERLADLYHRQGLVNEARTQYQVLADYYINQENSASASSIYQRMVELEPQDPSHRAKLAELYHQQQFLDKAIEQYRAIADIMLSHDQVEQAEQVFLRALDVSAEDLEFVENAAARLRKAGDLDAARRVLEAAAERNPAAQDLLEPEEQPSADPSSVPQEVPEQVLDSADEFLGDDAELMQALRDADEAVGEAPVTSSQPAAADDDLVLDWNEEESESLVRPPADLLEQPEPGLGFGGESAEDDAFGSESQTFELDLGELEDLAAARESADTEGSAADLDFGSGLEADDSAADGLEPDLGLSEPEEEQPAAGAINEDYLSEAEVLAKYGLQEKALERVQQVLTTHPEHPGAHRILVQLYLEDDDKDSAREVAQRLAGHSGAQESEDWGRVLELLAGADIPFEAPSPVAADAAPPAEAAEPQELDLSDLSEPAGEAALAEDTFPLQEQDLDFSDLEASEELEASVEDLSPERAPAPQEEELFLDDLEASAFDAAPAEESAATSAADVAVDSDDLGLEDVKDLGEVELVAEDAALAAPELEEASFGEPTLEEAALEELTLEEPILEDSILGGPALESPEWDLEAAGTSIEETSIEELPIEEISSAEAPEDASPDARPPGETAPSEKRLSPDSSKRINRLLESLLDDVPAPRKKKRKKSRDSEVDRILGMAAKKKASPKASPPSASEASTQEPLTGPPAAEQQLETVEVPPDMAAPEMAPADVVPVDAVPPGEAPAEPPSAELASAELTSDEPVGAEAAAEEAAEEAVLADERGPVEVQIGVPESAADEDLEDHSDIEDALSFMEPVSGSLPPPVSAIPPEDIVDLDDTGTSWLDEVSSRPQGQPAAEGQIFEEEEGFFDLGAELEEELSVSDAVGTEPPAEQSLEEIVEGFKQGVAEALSAEDYETHFDLGIAYREMGLLDEAIGEFQIAAKSPAHLVQCCSMLGMCFLEKGLPELAVKWYSQGLQTPDISEEDSLALLYDLGEVYLSTGDTTNAHKAFVEVYGINTNFRDIASRVAETRPA